MNDTPPDSLRILIVAEHASARFGGEAALPLHYFRVLRRRGFAVWLITHARTRAELQALFPSEIRIRYVEDTRLHKAMWHVGRRLPARIAYFTTGFVSRFAAQLEQRRIARELVESERIDIVHQPMPVSPKEPSVMYGVGAPVIIGPMNGGMDYPPAFRRGRGSVERAMLVIGRFSATAFNWLMPGKRRAAMLLVANARTHAALPGGVCAQVVELVENGVDLDIWQPAMQRASDAAAICTFAYVGRLVDWKAVDLLIHAFRHAAERAPMRLLVIGDGVDRPALEALAASLGVRAETADGVGTIHFTGWLSQQDCAERLRQADGLVLPSLLECGGAVVLEAMATGTPVIATAWGGPLDYLDASCGVLVPPTDRESLIAGLADAMAMLATSPGLRAELGASGRAKILREYNWDVKVDRMLALYAAAVRHGAEIPRGDTSRPTSDR